jgi:predicted RNase H-like HicB family nuclease
MRYEIVLTKDMNNGYSAHPVLFPSVVVTGTDEKETLDRMRAAIMDVQSTSRIVSIDVPIETQTPPVDPWLGFAGIWANETNWKTFQSEIEAYRHSIDEQTHPEESVTGNG